MNTEGPQKGTAMPRIPLVDSEDLTPAQRQVYDTIVAGPRGTVVGPLRAALHSPELADRWQKLGEYLRYRTALTVRQSELAIIAVARHWNSDLEWSIHVEVALGAGLDPAVVDAIRHARSPVFTDPTEALIYEYTRQLLAHGQVADEVYADLYASFTEVQMVELTALVGYYTMVAMTLNAHAIPSPTGGGQLPQASPPSHGPARVTRLAESSREPVAKAANSFATRR
jgi:4-carboxymuconolactone decarboxylase